MEVVESGQYDKLVQSTNKSGLGDGLNLVNAIDCYRDTGDDSNCNR